MFSKFFQRLRHQVCVVLFGIALISTLCVVPAEATSGRAVYNGVDLPDIDSVWTDKEVYSYAAICFMRLEPMGLSGNVYALYLVEETPVLDGSILETINEVSWASYYTSDTADASELMPGLSTFSWLLEDEGEFNGNPVMDGVLWVSHDTYNSDGSLVLSGGIEASPEEGGDKVPDFSNTQLSLFDPNIEATSADWGVRWSDLPACDLELYLRPHAIDSSGHVVSSVLYYLGGASSSGEHEFTLYGLSPSTAYTLVLNLAYKNPDDPDEFINTGVSLVSEFTTLASDPGLPDEPGEPDIPVDPGEPDAPGSGSGGAASDNQDVIGAIKDASEADREWMDEQYNAGVGSLPDDTADFDGVVDNLAASEEAYKNEAYARFQEISSSFNGFDGSVGSGISLAGTLFSRFFSALGSYKIVYTFPLLLAVAFVAIGRLGRSSFKHERSDHDQFLIDGW